MVRINKKEEINPKIILDYDGYVAKGYYTAIGKDEYNGFEDCYSIMHNLERYAMRRATEFFNKPAKDIEVYRVISGHTFKKDFYPSYKATRKDDQGFGEFRDDVIANMMDDLVMVPNLEADDVCTIVNWFEPDTSIVFSDDKDLHKYCLTCCKLNDKFDIQVQDKEDVVKAQLIQMLTGDRTDNIIGIPGVGEKTGQKLLDNLGYDLDMVINIYRNRQIEPDICMRDLILVNPLVPDYVSDIDPVYEIYLDIVNKRVVKMQYVYEHISNVMKFFRDKIRSIYYEQTEEVNKTDKQ